MNGDETSTATNGATRKDGGDDPFAFLADASSIQQGKGTDAETEGNNELSCDIEAEIKAQRAEFAKAQASKGEEEKAASIKFGDFEITDLDGDGKIDSTDLLLRQLSGGDQLQKANTMARLPPPPPPPHHEQRRQIALAIVRLRSKEEFGDQKPPIFLNDLPIPVHPASSSTQRLRGWYRNEGPRTPIRSA